MSVNTDHFINIITEFLTEIGIAVEFGLLEEPTFLPGLAIQGSTVRVDREKLLSPGDILHEAGHIALTASENRGVQGGNLNSDPGIEMGVLAWTYAAALHLGIAPEIVFHADGYRGGSQSLVENFQGGRYIGVPILQWLGLACEPGPALAAGVSPYPWMCRWLRE